MTDVGFPWVSCSPVERCAVDSNFPQVSCSPVEMCAVDSNFPRASFPPSELCAERQDCIRPGLWNDFMIDAAPVTGSLIYSAGPDGLSVTGGPIGQHGTLSAIFVDHGGTLPSSDLAGMRLPVIPVGPTGLLGTLPRLTLTLLARMARLLLVARRPTWEVAPIDLRVGDTGGTLEAFTSSDLAGMLLPAIPVRPVGI